MALHWLDDATRRKLLAEVARDKLLQPLSESAADDLSRSHKFWSRIYKGNLGPKATDLPAEFQEGLLDLRGCHKKWLSGVLSPQSRIGKGMLKLLNALIKLNNSGSFDETAVADKETSLQIRTLAKEKSSGGRATAAVKRGVKKCAPKEPVRPTLPSALGTAWGKQALLTIRAIDAWRAQTNLEVLGLARRHLSSLFRREQGTRDLDARVRQTAVQAAESLLRYATSKIGEGGASPHNPLQDGQRRSARLAACRVNQETRKVARDAIAAAVALRNTLQLPKTTFQPQRDFVPAPGPQCDVRLHIDGRAMLSKLGAWDAAAAVHEASKAEGALWLSICQKSIPKFKLRALSAKKKVDELREKVKTGSVEPPEALAQLFKNLRSQRLVSAGKKLLAREVVKRAIKKRQMALIKLKAAKPGPLGVGRPMRQPDVV